MPQDETPEIWITGVAAVTGLGPDLASTWTALLAGRTAGQWVDLQTLAGQLVHVPAAPAQSPVLADVPFEISSVRSDRLAREVARQAVCDTHLGPAFQRRTAIAFGSSKPAVCTWFVKQVLKLPHPADPFEAEVTSLPDYPAQPTWDTFTPQRGAVQVARMFESEGPILSSVSACSTGLHSIIRAVQWLQEDGGSIVFAGAVESSLNPLFASSFLRMRVVAADQPEPSRACRPFNVDRSGFIIGEGAGALVLETAEHARSRGARPIAIIAGYARGADPTGLADMDPQGRPLTSVIRRCLTRAQVRPRQIAFIKAHGTATQQNDVAESAAIRAVFDGRCPPVISLKGHFGHCLGASGAIETAICVKAMAAGMLPVTANLTSPDPQCEINHPRQVARIFDNGADHVLCLSAGFGGHLAALLLRRPAEADSRESLSALPVD